MLSYNEKILFIMFVIITFSVSYVSFRRMVLTINRGQGSLPWDSLPSRVFMGIKAVINQNNMIRNRPLISLMHSLVVWGFIIYLLVNIIDVAEGLFSGFVFLEDSTAGNFYRFIVDVMTVAIIAGLGGLLIRRFIVKSGELNVGPQITLHPKAIDGIRKDSLIVALFILCHVGFRLLGMSFNVAASQPDSWQPFATQIAKLWMDIDPTYLTYYLHTCWWLSIGSILVFFPYFPYSKHAHLFMAPFNLMTSHRRETPSTLDPLDFEDETIDQFGAGLITHLNQTQITDAFACIMCNRCQDACPAYLTGKELSPAALEINKRYYLRDNMKALGDGEKDNTPLMHNMISESGLWACTTCGACTQECPVGNEPMFDIIAMRQNEVLMESKFPTEFKGAFTGIERNGNPWQMTTDRMDWTAELDFHVPTIKENPSFEILYWVGCAGAFDPIARDTARAIATILNHSGTNFAVLGNDESCTGDLARRAGNEFLFSVAAENNIKKLNSAGVDQKSIVTGCPHCLHTIKNEYKQLGGNYQVVHHTQLIEKIINDGKINFKKNSGNSITFHDPCYLGRNGGVYDSPRNSLKITDPLLTEMSRNKKQSFCCGGGGAQVWKEEEAGEETVSDNRFREATKTGAETLAVGCPFCAKMLGDANKRAGDPMEVKDVAEIIAESITNKSGTNHG